MPGLVGFVGDQPPETTKLLLDTMAQKLMHEPWHKVQLHHGEGFGIGRVSLGLSNPEPQPIWSEDKQLCLVMEGEIFGYEDLKQGLIAKGHNFKQDNDADFVLHLYQDVGDKFPSYLNGAFVIAICDLREHKLILANDRFGLRPLYYAQHKMNLIFSSGLRALCPIHL
jgi:asparagine synthase (glutamine-hydrolysing)